MALGTFDFAAIYYGAVVSTAALSVEISRWVENGPRLRIKAMQNAKIIAARETQNTPAYILLTMSNCGDLPTAIKMMVMVKYKNWWDQLLKRNPEHAVVPKSGLLEGVLPSTLGPGRTWTVAVRTDNLPELEDEITHQRVYLGVTTSHRKKAYLVRLKQEHITSSR